MKKDDITWEFHGSTDYTVMDDRDRTIADILPSGERGYWDIYLTFYTGESWVADNGRIVYEHNDVSLLYIKGIKFAKAVAEFTLLNKHLLTRGDVCDMTPRQLTHFLESKTQST